MSWSGGVSAVQGLPASVSNADPDIQERSSQGAPLCGVPDLNNLSVLDNELAIAPQIVPMVAKSAATGHASVTDEGLLPFTTNE